MSKIKVPCTLGKGIFTNTGNRIFKKLIYFLLCGVAGHGLLSSCGARTPHCGGSSGCGARAVGRAGSVAVMRGLRCPAARGIFQISGGICISCLGRWILYHWATREVAPQPLLSHPTWLLPSRKQNFLDFLFWKTLNPTEKLPKIVE